MKLMYHNFLCINASKIKKTTFNTNYQKNRNSQRLSKCCRKCRIKRLEKLKRRDKRRRNIREKSRSSRSDQSNNESLGNNSVRIDPNRTSPSFLEIRRITSARKLPIPYKRKWSSEISYSSD